MIRQGVLEEDHLTKNLIKMKVLIMVFNTYLQKVLNLKNLLILFLKKKILKKWRGKHLFLSTNKKEDKKHNKIIGNKGNNAISKYLLKNINCTFNNELMKIYHKDKIWELSFSDGTKKFYKSIILTCPFPQLKKISNKYIKHSFIKKKVKMDANITVMMATKKSKNDISSYFFSDSILGWAANENSKKRFKSDYNLWTLQSTYEWANKKINKNKINKLNNAKILISKFFELTKLKKERIFHIQNHGWKYSSNSRPLNIKSYWSSSIRLGVCADWFLGPRLESGWLSAKDLSLKIKK